MLRASSLGFIVSILEAGILSFGNFGPPANLLWTHPYGHNAGAPCVHLAHPGGDAGVAAPCLCPRLAEHPGGHPSTVPCVHKQLRHPGGHDTGKKDPFGRPIMTPCTEFDTVHPNGDPGPSAPCTHLTRKPHAEGHKSPNMPCRHVLHPEGHGVITPCNHPVAMDMKPNDLGLRFFTTDPQIRDAFSAAAAKLKIVGIQVGAPRALSVFYREPINGDPNDNTDPFWSHYNPVLHAIQLTKGRAIEDLKETALHEVGHALLGHKAVHIKSKGGPHSIDDANDAGLAMSEGWAHFVGLYLSGAPKTYKGFNWDDIEAEKDIPYSIKNEFRVACILWDLYDQSADRAPRGGGSFVAPRFTFRELFRVYSPTLATLSSGPVIPSIDDFLSRLKKNVPNKAHLVDAIRKYNLTAPN